MGDPKSGRSGASECERSEARAPTGFQGAKRGQDVWSELSIVDMPNYADFFLPKNDSA
jgi:hypothetical protein